MSKCPWVELSVGRVVRVSSCPGSSCPGSSCPRVKLSVGRVVRGRVVRGSNCLWVELSVGRVVRGSSCPATLGSISVPVPKLASRFAHLVKPLGPKWPMISCSLRTLQCLSDCQGQNKLVTARESAKNGPKMGFIEPNFRFSVPKI